MKKTTLAELRQIDGERRIKTISGDPLFCARLQEMGFIEGATVKCVGQAPFKGPQLVSLGATVVALRFEEALCAEIAPLLENQV